MSGVVFVESVFIVSLTVKPLTLVDFFSVFFLGAPMHRPTTNAVLTLSYVVRLAFGTVFQPNLYKLAVLQNVRFRVCI